MPGGSRKGRGREGFLVFFLANKKGMKTLKEKKTKTAVQSIQKYYLTQDFRLK
jgi:hypothetical protein